MDIFLLVLQIALAAILAVAAVGKLIDLPGSRAAVRGFGVPAPFAGLLGTALPIAELGLAALLLFGGTARLGALGALLLFLAFIAAIGWNLRQGRTPDCHCFGELHSAPAGWQTIARNGLFALMALIVVVMGGRGPIATLENLTGTEQLGIWLTLMIVALGVVQALYLRRLVQQQNQLRAEIEALQTTSLFATRDAAPAGGPAVVDGSGETAPGFDLPTLHGGRLTLDQLRSEGRPALLLFTSPECGYCSAMYPEVADWAARFGTELDIAVIGRGDIGENREKLAGHAFPHVAVDEDAAVPAAYDAMATPSAVIVRPDGTLAGSIARGRPAIQNLVGSALRDHRQRPAAPVPTPISEPAVGSWPAPAFELATPNGGAMTLSGLLAGGKPVLLIFWSTTCGFCDRFAPEVSEWQRRFGNDVTIALLSDADIEANREQMATFGFVNVGVQAGREVMQSYGGTGTPSAVLVRPDGFVRNPVASGAPEIRTLLARVVDRGDARPIATSNGEAETGTEDDEARIRQSLLRSLAGPGLGTTGSRLPWATLDGDFIGLDEYLDDEVTLVFWGVDCAFSQRMLPDLREWETDAGDATDRVVIVSAGDVEANRAQGLRARVVIDDGFTTGGDFGVSGTPAAIRLDAEGRVASPLAVGADAVLDLLYDSIEAPAEPTLGQNRIRAMR